MKLFLPILSFFLFITPLFAQDDEDGTDRIRDKMKEYIQKRMMMTGEESAKFAPLFNNYYKEWRATLRENRNDRLILQQKIVELRLRYRTEFRTFLGEKRSNEVYRHQDIFIQELKNIRRNRMQRRNNNRSVIERRQIPHSNLYMGLRTS